MAQPSGRGGLDVRIVAEAAHRHEILPDKGAGEALARPVEPVAAVVPIGDETLQKAEPLGGGFQPEQIQPGTWQSKGSDLKPRHGEPLRMADF